MNRNTHLYEAAYVSAGRIVTLQMIQDELGIGVDTARAAMEALVEIGAASKTKVKKGRTRINRYSVSSDAVEYAKRWEREQEAIERVSEVDEHGLFKFPAVPFCFIQYRCGVLP